MDRILRIVVPNETFDGLLQGSSVINVTYTKHKNTYINCTMMFCTVFTYHFWYFDIYKWSFAHHKFKLIVFFVFQVTLFRIGLSKLAFSTTKIQQNMSCFSLSFSDSLTLAIYSFLWLRFIVIYTCSDVCLFVAHKCYAVCAVHSPAVAFLIFWILS